MEEERIETEEINNSAGGDSELVTKEQLEETTDRLKRVMAEFENFKKRSGKEREFLYGSLVADIMAAFLPVLDNLEKAAAATTEDQGYKEGIELVLKQFNEVLAKFNVKPIESVGMLFDPELHEAVASVQDDSIGEKIIKEEYRKGYIVGNKVIRHAMVVVAN